MLFRVLKRISLSFVNVEKIVKDCDNESQVFKITTENTLNIFFIPRCFVKYETRTSKNKS